MHLVKKLHQEVVRLSDPQKAAILQRFFKTGKGEYGYGDVFAGLTVPQSRLIAKKYAQISLPDVSILLKSKIHEERLIALLILASIFTKYSNRRKQIFDFYLAHILYINNWDLVDLSADKIVGGYLSDRSDRSILLTLAKSSNMWERRIAMIATFNFIKAGDYQDTLLLAGILLHDREDLIQKATGWMLREVGKRNSRKVLEDFLLIHYRSMPRTTLRYAIEKFPEELRLRYLKG
jgi:3-methyladenine DNA glycosylase AlkD